MSAVQMLLLPLSWLYGLAVGMRNMLYDRGLLPRRRAGCPVVSVGNLTAGGTGKTPMVSHLAAWAEAEGLRFAIIGRGYRRTSTGTVVVSDGERITASAEEAGDELLLLARRHPRAVVIADEERYRGAVSAVSSYAAQLIILDDGFQHRALRRDLDIVMIDASQPLPPMLPAGLRREPLGALRRASILVFSNASAGGADRRWAGPAAGTPEVRVRYVPLGLRRLGESALRPSSDAAGRRVVAFCGIGNPESFRSTLKQAGLEVRELVAFRDHARYGIGEQRRIEAAVTRTGAELLVTTEKDAVKLEPAAWPGLPVFVLAVGLEFVSGREALERQLREVTGR